MSSKFPIRLVRHKRGFRFVIEDSRGDGLPVEEKIGSYRKGASFSKVARTVRELHEVKS